MDKLKMQSENLVDSNIDKIAAVFPNCVTEGKNEKGEIIRVVDFELLKQELSKDIVEGTDERYTLNWAGKKQSILTANAPIAKTLRPCREESVDFDNTKNLYIEGDNLDVLKLLRETYLNKVKMIYIDPPYNTGNDFVYEDDFAESSDSYFEKSKSFDEQGNRLFQNNDSNGRFHSDWLSMMFSRLRLAKDLLTDDGVIFISIDDNEQANLKKICDEVFGADNFVGTIIWERAFAPKNDAKYLSDSHDYVIFYAKNLIDFSIGKLPRTEESKARYKNPDNDPRGVWISDNLTVKTYSATYDYPIITPSGKSVSPSHGSCWRVSKERLSELIADNRIYFANDGEGVPRLKRFLSEVQDGMTPTTLWKFSEVGHNQEARQELKKLFDDKGYFDGPKPVRLLSRILTIANISPDDLILDFFSGSATTAHAVMQLNAEDGGNRKFIMVQLPEKTDEASEAFKAGFKNICEIGKERIRRAGKKIQAENQMTAPNLDIGFRVLKLDTTCMKDVYYVPSEVDQGFLSNLESNIKEDRTAEDLLFQVMRDMGVILSSQINILNINGKKVFNVNDNNLICCFDSSLTDDVVTQIAKMKPLYSVFRDSSMESDSTAVNFDQIFSTYSPSTVRRVI